MSDLTSFDAAMRDLYPSPGTRVKQWVVDEYKLSAWVRATCPLVKVWPHRDNTGSWCRHGGPSDSDGDMSAWLHLSHHDCCYWCGNLAEATESRPDIAKWRAEYTERKLMVCIDRDKLSDEIAEDMSLFAHPLLEMMKR